MILRVTPQDADHALRAKEHGCACGVCEQIALTFAKARVSGATLRVEVSDSPALSRPEGSTGPCGTVEVLEAARGPHSASEGLS